jgi:hypothetical protein
LSLDYRGLDSTTMEEVLDGSEDGEAGGQDSRHIPCLSSPFTALFRTLPLLKLVHSSLRWFRCQVLHDSGRADQSWDGFIWGNALLRTRGRRSLPSPPLTPSACGRLDQALTNAADGQQGALIGAK